MVHDRLAGLLLALAIQALLTALLLFSRATVEPPTSLARELVFVLSPLPKPAPPWQILPPMRAQASLPPMVAPPAAAAPLSGPITILPLPQDLSGLGQSVYGCAPEAYANLPPGQKARCPRPGEGVARQAPDFFHPPPNHIKGQAVFEEQYAEEHFRPIPCVAGADTVECILKQEFAEGERAKQAQKEIAARKAAAQRPPPLPDVRWRGR